MRGFSHVQPPERRRKAPMRGRRLCIPASWRPSGALAEAWRQRRYQGSLRRSATVGSLGLHGLLALALSGVVIEQRRSDFGERSPFVVVDIGRLVPPPALQPIPPSLPELPCSEMPLPEPPAPPPPPPLEAIAVDWHTDSRAMEPDLEQLLAQLRELAPTVDPELSPQPQLLTETEETLDTSPQWRLVHDAIVRMLRYPDVSRQRGEEGYVWLVLKVRGDGTIESLHADGDVPRLVAAAVTAVRRAAPFPGAGPAVYRIPVSFRLTYRNRADQPPAALVTSQAPST